MLSGKRLSVRIDPSVSTLIAIATDAAFAAGAVQKRGSTLSDTAAELSLDAHSLVFLAECRDAFTVAAADAIRDVAAATAAWRAEKVAIQTRGRLIAIVKAESQRREHIAQEAFRWAQSLPGIFAAEVEILFTAMDLLNDCVKVRRATYNEHAEFLTAMYFNVTWEREELDARFARRLAASHSGVLPAAPSRVETGPATSAPPVLYGHQAQPQGYMQTQAHPYNQNVGQQYFGIYQSPMHHPPAYEGVPYVPGPQGYAYGTPLPPIFPRGNS